MPKAAGVLFCGGGTGGHVLPGLAVASQLQLRGVRPLRWIGDPQRLEARLVPRAGISLLPLGLSRPRVRDPRWLLAACRQFIGCWRELMLRPPRVVIALGGYAALAPGLIAPWLRRPLVVMEQNARPGRTNRLLARFSQAVITQFPEAAGSLPHRRSLLLGNPVRAIELLPRGQRPRLRVLVVGGSLAAKTLNDLLLVSARELAGLAGLAGMGELTIVHLAGEEDRLRVESGYAAAGLSAEVHGFVDDMPLLYRSIDIAITRAGATTVAELCAAGIPAIYIPLPWSADDHQTANANAVVRVGGAVLLPQAAATAHSLAQAVGSLARDRAALGRMGACARTLARPFAAACVAQLVGQLGSRQRRTGRRGDARTSWQRQLGRGSSPVRAGLVQPGTEVSAPRPTSHLPSPSPSTTATALGGSAPENA
jgi:UDP-N-acetylglucosamine--N-acetylmuramyl-(pentapeptide) pyrophosphoryl-undecaprenol N-acetylglucosamine transferase